VKEVHKQQLEKIVNEYSKNKIIYQKFWNAVAIKINKLFPSLFVLSDDMGIEISVNSSVNESVPYYRILAMVCCYLEHNNHISMCIDRVIRISSIANEEQFLFFLEKIKIVPNYHGDISKKLLASWQQGQPSYLASFFTENIMGLLAIKLIIQDEEIATPSLNNENQNRFDGFILLMSKIYFLAVQNIFALLMPNIELKKANIGNFLFIKASDEKERSLIPVKEQVTLLSTITSMQHGVILSLDFSQLETKEFKMDLSNYQTNHLEENGNFSCDQMIEYAHVLGILGLKNTSYIMERFDQELEKRRSPDSAKLKTMLVSKMTEENKQTISKFIEERSLDSFSHQDQKEIKELLAAYEKQEAEQHNENNVFTSKVSSEDTLSRHFL
jgi:hypothetical protein